MISEISRSINLHLRSFSVAIYGKLELHYLCLFRLFSGLSIVQFWFANCASYFRPSYFTLWPVLILEVFSSWDIKKGQFQFLLTFLVVFFWSVNCTNQVCIPSHTLNMGNILSEGFWYLVFLFLAFLSILSLLFLAVFPDLEMLQFWSVNYICLVCKLYYNFGHFQNFGQYLYECFWTIFECF